MFRRIESPLHDIIEQDFNHHADELLIQLTVCEPRSACGALARSEGGQDIHLPRGVLDGFHLRDHVAGFEVLDCGLEDGVVEVGFGFYGFGPGAVGGGFVDVCVYDFLLCCEAAVSGLEN